MKIYMVTFDTYKNRVYRHYEYYCLAPNAKEAVRTAKENWNREPHQFHISAVRTKVQDTSMLADNILGQYIVVDRKTYKRT